MTRLPEGIAATAEQVSRRELSATDVVTERLKQAQSSQPTLNAFTMIDHDGALAAAAALDERIADGEDVGPLAGVPIAIKDLIDHAGRPTTAGSSMPVPNAETSATVVKRLEASGAIIIGRTGLHEYAFGFSSENHWFGPVRNPWDTTLSPGGSSGGSGAAVAAGIVPAALGTDTGGSVRVPAALCGVVGLKVTHGRVPLTGVFPLAPSLDTVGPLAGSVADAALVYLAMAGHDSSDPWSSPRPVVGPGAPTDLRHLILGIPHPWVDLPQTDLVADSFAAAIRALRTAGATLVDLDLPDLVPAKELEYSVYPEVAVVHQDRWHRHPESYGPDVSRRLGEVFDIDPLDYVRAQEWRARLRHRAEAALVECDFLITPAVAAAAKPIGKEMIQVGGKSVSYRPALSRYSALVNHIGLPAITIPLDMDSIPPPSLQIIGHAWEEHRLLEMGAALERCGLSRRRRPAHAFD
jgi:aspartyl-tRNA(Asn)/glutamyl-tRNA(Gln) amidotransferase subunit A